MERDQKGIFMLPLIDGLMDGPLEKFWTSRQARRFQNCRPPSPYAPSKPICGLGSGWCREGGGNGVYILIDVEMRGSR